MSSTNKTWLPELEGLRGFAAAWVFLGHICILVQCDIPILKSPGYGVDLFIILSGFLMTKNYIERQSTEPWDNINTIKNFWLRRFFRIAPLYYLLLCFAIYFGPEIGQMRDVISTFYPNTATDINRFNDQTIKNTLIHASFVFGLIPEYSFRTTLPDWSIGLEMQYYLVFPLIMLVSLKSGLKKTLLAISFLATTLYFIFPTFYKSFPMASFILLKLPIFIAGMLLYLAVRYNKTYLIILPIIAILFASITKLHIDKRQLILQIAMCVFIFYILRDSEAATRFNLKEFVKKIFNNKISMWLGDVSYSVYLIHLLIVTPTIGIALESFDISHLHPIVRFSIVALISTPIVYLLANITYNFVEKPGMLFGRKFLIKSNAL